MAKKEKLEEVIIPATEIVETETVVTAQAEHTDKAPASIGEDGVIKLDLRKQINTEQDAVQKQETTAVDANQRTEDSEGLVEEISQVENAVQDETDFLEDVTNEKEIAVVPTNTVIPEAVIDNKNTLNIPDNLQKVIDFMNETNGTLEDYVRLNTDYNVLDEDQLLKEYYYSTKPHLDRNEVDFLLEDNFSYDEEIDEDRDIRKKQIARKEELRNAKKYLDGLKSKYYEEIKLGSKLNPEQQKAVEFFNRHNKDNEAVSQIAEKQVKTFLNKTEQLFSNDFKGFDYQVGDKKYRFKVNNAPEVKNTQSDINNFVKKFLNADNEMSDAQGYHKGLFTAMNADSVAQHFYEQGKADAVKESLSKSKNIQMGARGVHEDVKPQNGWTVRSVDSGNNSSKLRIKTFKNIQ